jgi:hypothetical protein
MKDCFSKAHSIIHDQRRPPSPSNQPASQALENAHGREVFETQPESRQAHHSVGGLGSSTPINQSEEIKRGKRSRLGMCAGYTHQPTERDILPVETIRRDSSGRPLDPKYISPTGARF